MERSLIDILRLAIPPIELISIKSGPIPLGEVDEWSLIEEARRKQYIKWHSQYEDMTTGNYIFTYKLTEAGKKFLQEQNKEDN